MSGYAVEGGPLDGQWVDWDGHIVRYPVPAPAARAVWSYEVPEPTINVAEYRREGSVYRYETLIGDAVAEMDIAAEAFREPLVRREARLMLRRALEGLAPTKEVDRIVWVLALDRRQFRFSLVAVVGGHRAEHAAAIREERRLDG